MGQPTQLIPQVRVLATEGQCIEPRGQIRHGQLQPFNAPRPPLTLPRDSLSGKQGKAAPHLPLTATAAGAPSTPSGAAQIPTGQAQQTIHRLQRGLWQALPAGQATVQVLSREGKRVYQRFLHRSLSIRQTPGISPQHKTIAVP